MKKLYRSRKDRMLAGILGGLAEYWNVDPTILRLGFVFLGLATAVFPFLFTYLIAWIIVPEKR